MRRKRVTAALMGLILCAGLTLSACATDNGSSETTESTANADTDTSGADTTVTEETAVSLDGVTEAPAATDVYVEAVDGVDEDFILGCDVSSLISEEKSGVVYYNEDGEEEDLLKILADHGVNTVRIRVWNDPYDSDGNGYGGGNNDTATAIEIGQRATSYGLSVIIDYHYSDFWADPNKQFAPKAWADMTNEEKATACYDFTKDSLGQILEAGVDVCMVQVGNETTTGIAGCSQWPAMCDIMQHGSMAIRELAAEYDKDIEVAVHFTNPENTSSYANYAYKLSVFGVDYDVFASSYYPVWHGSLENLTTVLSGVAEKYNKKVMVAEISYPYTFENGDQFGNSLSEETSCDYKYTISAQGQANAIRDAAAAVAACGDAGIGVCYWEPAWIPVPGDTYDEQFALWEANGSGWASSYSTDYDPDDAGIYYGGSSWDNQALFDFTGHPLASLSTFKYLAGGNAIEVAVDSTATATVKSRLGEEVVLPTTVTAIMNDRSELEIPVVWNDTNDYSEVAKYTVTGLAVYNGYSYPATCTVNIVELNYVENMSFEDDDTSMWKITASDTTDEAYIIEKTSDAYDGNKSFHFYSSDKVDCSVEQTITGLEAGTYKISAVVHGGDAGEEDEQNVQLYAVADGETYTANATLTGWTKYQYPVIDTVTTSDGTITVGMLIQTKAGSWGNVDYFVVTPAE